MAAPAGFSESMTASAVMANPFQSCVHAALALECKLCVLN